MKKFLLSVFAAAMAMGANAKNDIYLSMDNQDKIETDGFKSIAVQLMIENDEDLCGFDASIILPSPLNSTNFTVKNIDAVDYYFVNSSRLQYMKPMTIPGLGTFDIPTDKINLQKKVSLLAETNRLYVSVISPELGGPQYTREQSLVSGNSGAVGTFYFDGSSLPTGTYEILLNSDNTSANSSNNYETFITTYDEGANIQNRPVSNVKKSFTFEIDQTAGTVKAVAAPTAKVTIYKADGSSEDVDYDFSEPYVPVKNSLLVTTDPRVTGKNVVISGVCAELVIDDTYGFYTPVDFTATKATYNRSVDAGKVVTACLPFAVPAADLKAEAYTLSSFDGADLHYTASATGMEANKPYVLRNTAAGQLVAEVANAEVKKTPTEMEVTAGEATHFGLLNEGNFVSKVEFDYYAYVSGKFVRVINLTVPAYRTAIKLATGTAIGGLKAGSLNELGIIFEGEETGVELIEAENGKVNVYDALGRAIRLNVEASEAVEGLKDGVYMVNGKKVIIRNK